MKPIIIFEFDSYDFTEEKAAEVDDFIKNQKFLKQYDVMVLWGGKAKVYYPCKSLTFYYHKLKTWLIRKTLKNSIF